ncbi:MAG TPA: hypothetical protein VLA48_02740 [Nitrososphaeraceae archaeon]|nr:hypothetical protein [Nitrososphaeraceae archaeon]
MKTRDKALTWYNSMGRTKREELSIDYYGSTLLDDVEIIEMYFEEVPDYTKEQLVKAMIWAENNGKHYVGTDKEGQLKQFNEYINKF